MAKRRRQDYTYLGEFTSSSGKDYKIRVLVDLKEILALQGPLANVSRYHRHRQAYGPFKVTVTFSPKAPSPSPTEKRTRRKKLGT